MFEKGVEAMEVLQDLEEEIVGSEWILVVEDVLEEDEGCRCEGSGAVGDGG